MRVVVDSSRVVERNKLKEQKGIDTQAKVKANNKARGKKNFPL